MRQKKRMALETIASKAKRPGRGSLRKRRITENKEEEHVYDEYQAGKRVH